MTEKNIGTIIDADINEKMEKSYLDYSMSVIISRALPDVRDGLKPVHRRVLTAMNDLNLQPSRPYRKSAKITGDTTGNYHPHGTASVYDTLVRLAQDFSLRYPLVDGQGNFGSVDGDSAAAERYTEARMTKIAMDLMRDLDKETVDYIPNYDGSREMPSVMPSVIPNLLVNGADGIAVGMATKIPPHNLTEICDALIALLENPDIDADGLMEFVQGPDFPTGGIIQGRRGIVDYITTGRGRVVVRGRTEIEEDAKGRARIIISELPYQVNKASLVEKIANLVRSDQLEGISDLRDESDRKGMHVVVVLKKDAYPQVVLNKLFTHTQLQQTFGVINLALVGHRPKVMTLKETMEEYLKFREEVVVRRTKYDLRKAEERAHILEGYRIALDNIDEIVELIKTSASPDAAKTGLIERFALSEIQAQAILDLRLARLTGLERQKIEDEYRLLIEKIAELKEILANRDRQLLIIREEVEEVREKYGDERRTSIEMAEDDIDFEDMIADEEVVITISHSGYAKRIPVGTYSTQGRGGKGITAMATKDEDWVEHLFIATTHQYLLVLTEKGQLYWLKAYRLPEATRTSKGRPIVNMLDIAQGDKVHAIVPVREFTEDHFLVMATNKGIVKRTPLTDFSRPRRAGIRAINLLEDEHLVDVKVSDGDLNIILATSNGMAIRFHESDMRPMGRTARGVKGVTLGKGQSVVGMVTVTGESTLLTLTEHGYGKRTPVDEYRIQRRGGRGLITIKCTERNGKLVGIKEMRDDQELMVLTKNGIMIRMAVNDISTLGRNTQGVRIISLKGDDEVAGMARIEVPEVSELLENLETSEVPEASEVVTDDDET
jgi:DNA gyrase subunit A